MNLTYRFPLHKSNPPRLTSLKRQSYSPAMLLSNGKRGRSDEESGMEISIDTDNIMTDSLKRIRLGSPVGSWPAASTEKEERDQDRSSRNGRSPPQAEYPPTIPLRRARSQLDDSIDDIIRKSRRRFESTNRPEYVDMQLIPVGPDPLRDRRILGTIVDGKCVSKARQTGSELWPVEGRHPNVYNYVQGAEQRPGQPESAAGAMDTTPDHSSAHYANDFSHAGWILSVDQQSNSSDSEMMLS